MRTTTYGQSRRRRVRSMGTDGNDDADVCTGHSISAATKSRAGVSGARRLTGRRPIARRSRRTDALAFSLRYQGRERVHNADELISEIVATRTDRGRCGARARVRGLTTMLAWFRKRREAEQRASERAEQLIRDLGEEAY